MEQTITKKPTFIVSIALSILLCLVFLFAGCNPTPPPANQITIEQMQASLLNFGQKVENLTNYTDEATPARTPEANENSELGLPYSLYEDFTDNIDYYYETYFDDYASLIYLVCNYFQDGQTDLALSQNYTDTSIQNTILTFNFSFNETNNTLTVNLNIANDTNPNEIVSKFKILLKLTSNNWISADYQIAASTTAIGFMHFTNNTNTDNEIKSCYLITSTKNSPTTWNDATITAIEYDTQKILSTHGTQDLTQTQHDSLVTNYLVPCESLLPNE